MADLGFLRGGFWSANIIYEVTNLLRVGQTVAFSFVATEPSSNIYEAIQNNLTVLSRENFYLLTKVYFNLREIST